MAETRSITLKICGKDFAVTIPVQDEYIYRYAAQELASAVAAYQAGWKGQPEDYIYLAALHMAVSKVRLEKGNATTKNAELLEAINKKLEEYITSAKIK